MAMRLVLLCVCAAALALPVAQLQRFDGSKVLRVTPSTTEQVNKLFALRTNLTIALGLDWWIEPSPIVSRHADVRVPASAMQTVVDYLAAASIASEVMIADVQSLVEAQLASIAVKGGAEFDFAQYHDLDEINTFIQTIPREYPELATLFKAATSYEGRNIYGVKITSKTGNSSTNAKPGFWIDGGIHAREWIAPATTLYMLNELITQYGKDETVTSLVDSLEIFIVPVFNVDGYVFTYTDNRMWRKTRSPNKGSSCIGTDPNRNWDDHWAEIGASGDPCDETYYGAAPFSEIEVKGIADTIAANENIQAYFNLHSYSQMFLTPWGWTSDLPPDYTTQMDLARKAVSALTAVYGTKYEYGPSSTTIYPTSGGSDDWTYGKLNIIHSYCMELRDTGRYGFLLPADQIIPTSIETFAAIKVAMKYILANPPAARRSVA